MSDPGLTQEEKELLESVERGEWRRIPNFDNEAKRLFEVEGIGPIRYKNITQACLSLRMEFFIQPISSLVQASVTALQKGDIIMEKPIPRILKYFKATW